MDTTTTVQFLIQGGAVGISLVCLYIIYKLVTNHEAHLLEAMERNTEAWNKNVEVLGRIEGKLDRMEK